MGTNFQWLVVSRADWPQRIHSILQLLRGRNEFLDQLLVFGIVSLVQRGITLLMAAIQKSPFGGRKRQGVSENLKNDEPVFRAIAMPAQGGEGEGMGRVIGKDKSAVWRK